MSIDLQTARNINKFKKIQERATKFILKTDDYDTKNNIIFEFVVLGGQTLFVGCFFLYRVLNGYISIDIYTYIQFYTDSDSYHLRGGDELRLKKNFARTTIFKSSFFNRIMDVECFTIESTPDI